MRILVFSAHSADWCSRAGGTLKRYVQEGAEARVVCLSFGERSESGGLYAGGKHPTLEDVRANRREGALRAAEIIGVEPVFMDWGDLQFEYNQRRMLILAEQIREYRPSIVLTHHGPDPVSMDHETTYQLVRRAMQAASAPGVESAYPHCSPELFLLEATVPLTEHEGFSPDIYIDVTDAWETKERAMREFAPAQGFLVEWYGDTARRRAAQAREITGNASIKYAEAFKRTLPWVGLQLPIRGA